MFLTLLFLGKFCLLHTSYKGSLSMKCLSTHEIIIRICCPGKDFLSWKGFPVLERLPCQGKVSLSLVGLPARERLPCQGNVSLIGKEKLSLTGKSFPGREMFTWRGIVYPVGKSFPFREIFTWKEKVSLAGKCFPDR